MKKFTTIAVAAGVVASGAMTQAHAQSSVTLYGLIDAGLVFNNNAAGSKQYALASGNQQGSRWGLKGNEDLGGGLHALFVLENGFSSTTGALGQGGAEFGRQAYVGLSSSSYGTITLGRQYDLVVEYLGKYISGTQWATGYGAHPGDLDNTDNNNRTNNAVKYRSANYNGASYAVMYGFGNAAGQTGYKQVISVGGGYERGALSLGASYLNARDPNYSYFGTNPSSSTTASNMSSLVYSGYASAHTQQVIDLGGSYNFGKVKLAMTYSNTQFENIGAEAGLASVGGKGNTAKFHNAEVNVSYWARPDLVLGVGYDYTKGYGVNDAQYHLVTSGIDYFLSKRTDLYISGLFEHASGTDSTGKAARANINQLTASTTANQVALIAGIRHKF